MMGWPVRWQSDILVYEVAIQFLLVTFFMPRHRNAKTEVGKLHTHFLVLLSSLKDKQTQVVAAIVDFDVATQFLKRTFLAARCSHTLKGK